MVYEIGGWECLFSEREERHRNRHRQRQRERQEAGQSHRTSLLEGDVFTNIVFMIKQQIQQSAKKNVFTYLQTWLLIKYLTCKITGKH